MAMFKKSSEEHRPKKTRKGNLKSFSSSAKTENSENSSEYFDKVLETVS
jgi:hypothetical protein